LGQLFIHEFPALEGKIEQFAKSLAFTRRRARFLPTLQKIKMK